MKKKPTQESIKTWIQLHRTHRLLLEKTEVALKQALLPPLDWYDILLELHREKDIGLRQYEISEKILLNKHNLSRLLDRLEKKRLVKRHTCAEDGRGNRIKITGEGEKMLKQMWPVYGQSIQENFTAKLNPDDIIELDSVLKKIVS